MKHRSFQTQALGLAAWLAASFVAGGLGAVASANAGAFYAELSQPAWAPPAWLFFVWHLGALSLVEIILLWLLIAATISAFWPLQRMAALMLAPYLAWVSFASALTYSLWRLNSAVLG